jgi:hypothetical protein
MTWRLLPSALTTGALVVVVSGCGGSSAPSSSTTAPTPSPTGAVVQRSTLSGLPCRSRTQGASGSNCKIVDVASKLRPCKVSSGGYNVEAFGISCKATADLLGTLQATWVAGHHASGEALYEPWAASGRFPRVTPTKPTGWTCWAALTPQAVQHVCWRGEQVILFKFG